jgi:hypothetical protein
MNDYQAGLQKVVVVDPSSGPLDYDEGVQKVELQSSRMDSLETSLADRAKNIIYVKSTDDLQSVLNSLTGSQSVILVDAVYNVSSPLTLTNVSLITIKGNGRAKINYTGTGNAFTFTNCDNITFNNISIIGNGANNGHGIAFNNCHRCKLVDSLVFNMGKDCLNLVDSFWFMSDNSVYDTPGNGYSCVNQGSNSNNMIYIHSRFISNQQTAFTATTGANTLLSGCDISGSGTGSKGIVILGGSSFSIEDCYFEGNKTVIQIGDSSHFLSNVNISNNYISSGGTAIDIQKGSNINIKGNYFFGGTTGVNIADNSVNTIIHIDSQNYFDVGITTKINDVNSRAYFENKLRATNQFFTVPNAGGAITIDLKNNSNFYLQIPDTLYRDVTFSNTLRSNNGFNLVYLVLKYDFAANIDWEGVTWTGGTKPSLTVGKTYLIQFLICGTLSIMGSVLASY